MVLLHHVIVSAFINLCLWGVVLIFLRNSTPGDSAWFKKMGVPSYKRQYDPQLEHSSPLSSMFSEQPPKSIVASDGVSLKVPNLRMDRTEEYKSQFATSDKIAVILVNYNMVERADNIINYIETHVKWPVDIILVDNGSEDQLVSKHTTVRVKHNVQTCNGWLMGLHYADSLEAINRESYFGYWVLITSTAFPSKQDNMDVLTPMVEYLQAHPNTVMAHPALTPESTTGWDHLKYRGGGAPTPRPTWMVDNIACLYRADWFNSIGRFDRALTMAWGVDVETSFLAAAAGRGVVVDDRVLVHKDTDIGYSLGRMGGMGAEERRDRARTEVCEIFGSKYGQDWPHPFFHNPEAGTQLGGGGADMKVDHWRRLCDYDVHDDLEL